MQTCFKVSLGPGLNLSQCLWVIETNFKVFDVIVWLLLLCLARSTSSSSTAGELEIYTKKCICHRREFTHIASGVNAQVTSTDEKITIFLFSQKEKMMLCSIPRAYRKSADDLRLSLE